MYKLSIDEIIEAIHSKTGIERTEISKMIQNKINELSGLISNEGAGHIIANELGINLARDIANKFTKIQDLMPGLRSISVSGNVKRVFPVRTFQRHGKEGKVASLVISDGTADVRVVIWDHRVDIIENGTIKPGYNVSIHDAFVKEGKFGLEVHLKDKSIIETKGVTTQKTNLSGIVPGDHVNASATIITLFSKRLVFYNCPICRKTLSYNESCPEHKDAKPQASAVVNLIVDDGSARLRCVLFGSHVERLFGTDIKALESMLNQGRSPLTELQPKLIAQDINFSGSARIDKFSNKIEVIIDDFSFEKPLEAAAQKISQLENRSTSAAS